MQDPFCVEARCHKITGWKPSKNLERRSDRGVQRRQSSSDLCFLVCSKILLWGIGSAYHQRQNGRAARDDKQNQPYGYGNDPVPPTMLGIVKIRQLCNVWLLTESQTT